VGGFASWVDAGERFAGSHLCDVGGFVSQIDIGYSKVRRCHLAFTLSLEFVSFLTIRLSSLNHLL
jgi:hypothetical protein